MAGVFLLHRHIRYAVLFMIVLLVSHGDALFIKLSVFLLILLSRFGYAARFLNGLSFFEKLLKHRHRPLKISRNLGHFRNTDTTEGKMPPQSTPELNRSNCPHCGQMWSGRVGNDPGPLSCFKFSALKFAQILLKSPRWGLYPLRSRKPHTAAHSGLWLAFA